jgi:hypothetical protein
MKPFERGRQDFLKGNLDNPYSEGSVAHKEWRHGFDKQFFKNLEESGTGGEEVYSNQESTAEEIN